MPNFRVLLCLFFTFFIQGCGSPEREPVKTPEDSSPENLSQQAGERAPEWFETVTDPKSEAQLHKSPADDRAYRFHRLENGMKVLLISDPEADKAAASLSIDIGSFENPPQREGLAHFLEHMLFLGTDKFPEPGEYQAFLTEHGGSFNAYTSMEETNYFFDIDPGYLVPTLDRFSRFFVAPLFNRDYVDRERHAVDSEYQLRIKDDSRREWDVLRELANPEHPFALFAVGNLETLKNTEEDPVREDLIAFYEKYYTASRMNLVVLGNESLDELDAIVRERFAGVPSHEVELEETFTPFFNTALPLEVVIEPEKEIRSLSFNFPMPSLKDDWRLNPAGFIGHLLGHEGEGSLLSVLKAGGMAEGLSSGLVFDSRHGALFSVRIQLTAAGVEREEKVRGLFFQWLQLVKDKGLEAWRYDEVARMSEIDFQFMEKSNPVNHVRRLSTSLHHYPPEEVLRGDYYFEAFNEPRMKKFLSHLTPDNVAIFFTAPDVETDRKTALYGAPYKLVKLEVADLAAPAAEESLQLPRENPYIPDELALINGSSDKQTPVLLQEAPEEIWFLGNNPYNTPKAVFEARINMPGQADIARDTGKDLVLALVKDQLSSEVYPAKLAGLDFSLNGGERGYKITVAGFDQKQPVLLERILQVLSNPDWDQARVDRVKLTLLRRWRNAAKEWPLRQLMARFSPLVTRDWLPGEKAGQLEKMTLEQVKAIHAQMVAGVSARFYGAGNLAAGSVQGMANQVVEYLPRADNPVVETIDIANLKPAKSLFATHYYVDHNDSAALLYLQGEADSLRERAMFALLEVMASAPFYSSLRTEKQLGYAVGSSIAPLVRAPGMIFYVQSPTANADQLRDEINGFFTELSARLDQLKQEDLDRYRNSVLANIEQSPMNLNELAQRHLESLQLGYDRFDFRERLVAALESVTLDEFRDAYNRVLLGERTGFWILSTTDKSVGTGAPLPEERLEEPFSYDY